MLSKSEILVLISNSGLRQQLTALEQKMGLVRDTEAAVLANLQAQSEPVACKKLCELCEKRGYIYCANAAKTTPLPLAPVQQEPNQLLENFDELEAQNKALLDALKECLLHINYDPTGDVSVKARAAIALVEGKQ